MWRGLGVLLCCATVAACVGCDDDDASGRRVAEEVAPQLAYLAPDSSLVAAVDLRIDGDNWNDLRPLISSALRAARAREGNEQIPPNVDGALELLASFGGLDFEDDVRPVLDGHLIIGVSTPPRQPLPDDLAELDRLIDNAVFDPRSGMFVRPDATGRPTDAVVRKENGRPVTERDVARLTEALTRRNRLSEPRTMMVYRSPGGNVRDLVDKLTDGDRLEAVPGHPDARLIQDDLALVGEDTLVSVLEGPEDALDRALDRAEAGTGFPAGRLAAAERDVDMSDPLVLAAGDLNLARSFVDEPDLRRAEAEVPYLGAIERISAGVDFGEEEAVARLRVDTRGGDLDSADLPLGPPGELELPIADAVAGASRDQSRTTTFAARVVRALFADSRFVSTVERAEQDLGASFEDEVLRQFDCPSVSVFENDDAPRFRARSCVRDPERMRELLPRLAPHLPRILTSMQGLGEEGLLGLLLVAPDAPLTPSALADIAQIVVRPFDGGEGGPPDEDLYEVTGLDDPSNPAVVPGVSQVVFGMIGDDFVVGSDREMARSAAMLETEPLDADAASALRIPLGDALAAQVGDEAVEVLDEIFTTLDVTFAAQPAATTAEARLGYER